MRSVEEWKNTLRAALREAMRARQPHASALYRELLATIDNAEAPAACAPPTAQEGPFAGSVSGLGATEVPRLQLSPEQVAAIIAREIEDYRAAHAEYVALGRAEEAEILSVKIGLLEAL